MAVPFYNVVNIEDVDEMHFEDNTSYKGNDQATSDSVKTIEGNCAV